MVITLDGRQMRWKCRRGMLELDYLLQNYFDSCYDSSSEEEKFLFSSLLDTADPELYQWLTLKALPENPKFEVLIHRILSVSQRQDR